MNTRAHVTLLREFYNEEGKWALFQYIFCAMGATEWNMILMCKGTVGVGVGLRGYDKKEE